MRESEATATFIIPRRFRPSYSLLGRWLRHRVGDDVHAGGIQVLVLVGAASLVVLVGQVMSALLGVSVFWQGGGLIGVGLIGLVGVQPRTVVRWVHPMLQIDQGNWHLTTRVMEVETISPLVFHRHYRRYQATRAFYTMLGKDLLLLHTASGPVVLGLAAVDQRALLAIIAADNGIMKARVLTDTEA